MIWKIWKYALGSFADDKTRDYDNVVADRTYHHTIHIQSQTYLLSAV